MYTEFVLELVLGSTGYPAVYSPSVMRNLEVGDTWMASLLKKSVVKHFKLTRDVSVVVTTFNTLWQDLFATQRERERVK